MNNTVIVIKDDYATSASAESILKNICTPLIAASADINLTRIVIAVNSNIEDSAYITFKYTILDKLDLMFTVITLPEKSAAYSFAKFHNYAVELTKEPEFKNVNLHIVSGSLIINNNVSDATSGNKTLIGSFITDLLELTTLLKRPVWFSTASDGANYAFGHYFTIADIINIDGKVKHIIAPKCIMWSGNSNLDWIYINTTVEQPVDLKFNTEYDYDFLSIKSMIAKSTITPGYFVNLFPTIPAEVGAFFRANEFNRDNIPYNFTDDQYKSNIELYSKNLKDIAQTSGNKTVNDVVAYMQSVLSAAK